VKSSLFEVPRCSSSPCQIWFPYPENHPLTVFYS